FQHLEDRLKNINLRNEASVLESMMPMVREVDKREGYTHGHTERLAKEVEAVAKGLGLSQREIQNVARAALLSNLGLLKVPEQILGSRQPLTEDQRRLIREHPLRSVEIIRDIAFLEPVTRDILYHHERYDGAGYPRRSQRRRYSYRNAHHQRGRDLCGIDLSAALPRTHLWQRRSAGDH
ncbi:MAG: HD domain-containing phosphohydrolase, partial [Candidatus Omnitrophota bacterium]